MTARFTAVARWESTTLGGTVSGNVTFTPSLVLVNIEPPLPSFSVIGTPVQAFILNGQLVAKDGGSLALLAGTADLGLPSPLQYTVRFTNVVSGGQGVALPGFTFIAPAVGDVTYDILSGEYVYTTTSLSIIGLTAGVTGFASSGDRKRRFRRSLCLGLANTKG